MRHTPEGHLFTEVVLEVFKLSGSLVIEGDRITSDYGLTSARWKILGAIARSDTPVTVPQIARSMGQTRQSVQRLVEAMHTDGLLDLLNNPNHKRAKLVALSSDGKEVYLALERDQIPWANSNALSFYKRDLETTLSTLKKMTQLF